MLYLCSLALYLCMLVRLHFSSVFFADIISSVLSERSSADMDRLFRKHELWFSLVMIAEQSFCP